MSSPRPTPPARPLTVVPLQREPHEEMIDYLREKLAQAEAGEISGCLLVVERADGTIGWRAFHGEHSTPVKLIGGLEIIQLEMVQREIERNR